VGSVSIRVSATDAQGASVFDLFDLVVSTQSGVTITGTAGIDTLTGTAGNDTINGLAGSDTLGGLDGNDTLNGGAGSDTMNGGTGDDTFVITGTDTGKDRVYGNAGFDTILGGAGDDTFLVEHVNGIEKIDGGGGTNVIFVDGGGASVVDLSGAELVNVSLLIQGGIYHNTITDGAGRDSTIDSGDGNDTLNGMDGNDTLIGGSGTDSLYGGNGNDLANGGDGNDTLYGDAGDDALEGMAGNDVLNDNGGNNYLAGFGGADAMTGNAGSEIFVGGAGNDAVATGAGADIIVFNQGDGQDTVSASTTQDNTVSLGFAIEYAELYFRRQSNNLVLETGANEQLTFQNWYAGSGNHSVQRLQTVTEATAAYDANSSDPLLSKKVQRFDFQEMVDAFDAARAADPQLDRWALMNKLLDAHLAGSDTEAMGGDLAYRYGLTGSLAGIGVTPAQGILSDSQFGAAPQALQPLAGLQVGPHRLS
jgi:Ca2+-binding RTX toxin-like protein